MRDLKHLIYFENLLQEANNDLVKQAKDEGKLALGYTWRAASTSWTPSWPPRRAPSPAGFRSICSGCRT